MGLWNVTCLACTSPSQLLVSKTSLRSGGFALKVRDYSMIFINMLILPQKDRWHTSRLIWRINYTSLFDHAHVIWTSTRIWNVFSMCKIQIWIAAMNVCFMHNLLMSLIVFSLLSTFAGLSYSYLNGERCWFRSVKISCVTLSLNNWHMISQNRWHKIRICFLHSVRHEQ